VSLTAVGRIGRSPTGAIRGQDAARPGGAGVFFRAPVIDYLVHSRKHGWECALICQDMVQIDKQVRESLVEYVIRCIRLDKVRIPVVGGFIAALLGEKAATMPKMHRASRRLGVDPKGLIARSWWYRDGDVQKGYDTLQVFQSDYPHGAHCLLSPWHLVGRFQPPKLTWWQRLTARAKGASGGVRSAPPPRPKLAIVRALQDKLPPDERLRHWRRLETAGLL
jgi:hypothetical protein